MKQLTVKVEFHRLILENGVILSDNFDEFCNLNNIKDLSDSMKKYEFNVYKKYCIKCGIYKCKIHCLKCKEANCEKHITKQHEQDIIDVNKFKKSELSVKISAKYIKKLLNKHYDDIKINKNASIYLSKLFKLIFTYNIDKEIINNFISSILKDSRIIAKVKGSNIINKKHINLAINTNKILKTLFSMYKN